MKKYTLLATFLLLAPAHIVASESSSASSSAKAEVDDPIAHVNQLTVRFEQARQQNSAATKKVEALQNALEEQAACGIACENAKTRLKVHLEQLQRCRLSGLDREIRTCEEELEKLKPAKDADDASRKEYKTKELELGRRKIMQARIKVALSIGYAQPEMQKPASLITE